MTRLIDADALNLEYEVDMADDWKTAHEMANIVKYAPTVDAIPIEWILNNERMPKAGTGRKVIMDMLEDWRKEHDTAEPVKHGKWIIRDNPGTGWYRVTCSECGEDFTATAPCIGFFPNVRVTWNYCPECGARIDGE